MLLKKSDWTFRLTADLSDNEITQIEVRAQVLKGNIFDLNLRLHLKMIGTSKRNDVLNYIEKITTQKRREIVLMKISTERNEESHKELINYLETKDKFGVVEKENYKDFFLVPWSCTHPLSEILQFDLLETLGGKTSESLLLAIIVKHKQKSRSRSPRDSRRDRRRRSRTKSR